MDVRGTWVVYIWSRSGDRGGLLAWVREHGDFDVRGPASMDRVLAVETQRLPDRWEAMFDRFDVQTIVVRTSGIAIISLRGTREEVRQLADSFGEDVELEKMIEAPEASSMSEEDPLTETERGALLAAYRAGYFSVPREIRLEDLAEELEKSSGALSTLLRRGVERLVDRYAREVLQGPPFPSEPDEEEAEARAADEVPDAA